MLGEIPIFPGIDVMVQLFYLRQKNTGSVRLDLCSEVAAHANYMNLHQLVNLNIAFYEI